MLFISEFQSSSFQSPILHSISFLCLELEDPSRQRCPFRSLKSTINRSMRSLSKTKNLAESLMLSRKDALITPTQSPEQLSPSRGLIIRGWLSFCCVLTQDGRFAHRKSRLSIQVHSGKSKPQKKIAHSTASEQLSGTPSPFLSVQKGYSKDLV